MEEIEKIRHYVISVLDKPGAHGLDHTLRVTRICRIIGEKEGAEMNILIPAALLHDIARPLEEKNGIPHEIEGARIAQELLLSLGYPDEIIAPVTHAIQSHRYRSQKKPVTLEAKILSDSDKLDAMGAIGIARTFMTAGERSGDFQDAIDHIHEKILNLQGLMYTDSARDLAEIRHAYIQDFIRTFMAEMETGF
jgi:uncharacterized protein